MLSLDCDPENANEAVNWSSSNESVATVADGTVTAVDKGKATITATTAVKKNTANVEVTVSGNGGTPGEPASGYGTIYLDYGKYTGDLKNGKPHGHGTITFSKSHKIVSSKDFVANPGDTFEGDFREGKVSGNAGYWKHGGEITLVKP